MRIIVKNLPVNIKSDRLKNEFSKVGTVTDISFPKNNNRTFCFIGYKTQEEAKNAVKHFNKSYLMNIRLKVDLVNDDYLIKRRFLNKMLFKEEFNVKKKKIESLNLMLINAPDVLIEDLKSEFQNLKKIRREDDFYVLFFEKMEDSLNAQEKDVIFGKRVKYKIYIEEKNENYYNSLFFDFTTVVERICEEEKIKKEDLVDLQEEDLGARIAILESHLVEQTKRWLDENRIDVSGNKVDKRVLLIRNYDLLNNLEGIGRGNVKISPSRCLAIVEFKKEKECEEVYKKFCMKRVKDKAIYCEYLPIKEKKEEEKKIKEIKGNKVIIKNVPFQANIEEIKKIIESQVKIKEIRMPEKRDGGKRGFCFVELENDESAKFVCEYFGKSTHLYGRRLVFTIAEK
ncbi:putative RNA-binding protein 19 [Gurleya vavrai]